MQLTSLSDIFPALDKDSLTKTKIGTVIRAVGRWRDLAQLYFDEAGLEKIEEMHNTLESLLAGLGNVVKRPRKQGTQKERGLPHNPFSNSSLNSLSAVSKVLEEKLNSLTSQEDVSEVLALYSEYFGIESTDAMPLDSGCPIGVPFGEPVEAADPGVKIEFGMTAEQLTSSLGFQRGLPFIFNSKRHKSGYTAWDPTHASLFDPKLNNPSLEDIRLHWHQLAGIHAIIRLIFATIPSPSHCTGVLLADEVGLGKTFQACTVIGFLGELAVRQSLKLQVPPIIGKSNLYRLPFKLIIVQPYS
jgi:hypothetical protein